MIFKPMVRRSLKACEAYRILSCSRCGCGRYHEAEGQWLLYRSRQHLSKSNPRIHQGLTPLSAQSVHAATRKTLLKVKGFSEVKVEKIKEAIQKLQVMPPPPSPRSSGGYRKAGVMHTLYEPS